MTYASQIHLIVSRITYVPINSDRLAVLEKSADDDPLVLLRQRSGRQRENRSILSNGFSNRLATDCRACGSRSGPSAGADLHFSLARSVSWRGGSGGWGGRRRTWRRHRRIDCRGGRRRRAGGRRIGSGRIAGGAYRFVVTIYQHRDGDDGDDADDPCPHGAAPAVVFERPPRGWPARIIERVRVTRV
jgi:hypothetical protein